VVNADRFTTFLSSYTRWIRRILGAGPTPLGAPQMERKHFYLPPQLLVRLKAFSEKRGVTAGEIVRQALEEYLKKNGG
jgi:hypothetical protein